MSTMPWYEFNWVDYIVLGVIGLSVVMSFFRGFARETLSLIIWAAGFIVAFRFAPRLATHIHQITRWEFMSFAIAFGILFAGVWVLGLLINYALRLSLPKMELGLSGRFLGMGVGAIRGLLIVSVLLMFVNLSPFKDSPAAQSSRLIPSFNHIVARLDRYVPKLQHRSTHLAMGGNE